MFSMKWTYFLVVLAFIDAASAKWTMIKEVREVEAGGKNFKCNYMIQHKGNLIINKKSKINCTPDLKTKLEHTEYFAIKDKQVEIVHFIKKKLDTIKSIAISDLTTTPAPTTEAPGGGEKVEKGVKVSKVEP